MNSGNPGARPASRGRAAIFTLLVPVAVALLPLPSGAADAWTKIVGNGTMPLGDGFGAGGAINASNKTVDAMTAYNGFLYASSGQNGSGTGNPPTVWRTSDLTHWTNVASGFVCTDLYMTSNTNGIFLATGNKYAVYQSSILKSSNGTNWSWFSPPASGYNQTNNFLALLGLQGGMLFSATANLNGGQVWKRPANGSGPWTKVLDFNSGFGTIDGPQTNLWSTYLYCPPSATNVMFYGTLGSTNCALYQSTDGGASWQRNAAAAVSFGTNNSEIAAIVEFNGYLYASTANAQGGHLWRTPLASGVNWSSPAAWEQVIASGLGTNSSNGELHRMIAAYGYLWICLTGPKAQVWRSADGTNWVQSNVNGFATTNNAAGGYQDLAAFTNAAGEAFTVWGGDWADPSNYTNQAAQVWATQIVPAGRPVITDPPQNVSTNTGANVRFSVGATGDPPLGYQWRRNATSLPSATNATLALSNVQTNDAGGYDAIVANGVGSATSQVATLSVSPVIVTNALPLAATVGTVCTQTLSAVCGAPPYAWLLVGGALPEGLTLSGAGQIVGTPGAAGTFAFTVQLTDAVGQVATGAFSIVTADPWIKVVGNNIVPLGDGFGAGGVLNTNNTSVISLNGFNGFLYAAVQSVSNRSSVWRSNDLLNWTNIPIAFPIDFHNIFDMQSNSNGIFFGTGYGMFPSGAQVWKSTNGVNWFVFSTLASGFLETNFNVMISLQGEALYATIGANITNGAAEVWKRPANGSANWTRVLDLNTGLGNAEGAQPGIGSSYIYGPPGATNAVFLPCNNGAGSCWIQQSADGGATWHRNAAMGTGFGDANNGYIAAVIEFKGHLYAGTGNSTGSQIWRTPLADATNWSSANPWEQVVADGFGNADTEFHRFAVAGGKLWTFLFTHSDLAAKVWCSGDGTHWVQSNTDDFGTGERLSAGSMGSFTGADGSNRMVWGGTWTSPGNSGTHAAQIWATPLAPAGAPAIATNAPPPVGVAGAAYAATLSAGGGTPPYTWALAGGALPDGLALGSDGQLTGTPALSGVFAFTVRVTDAAGQSATADFSIGVADPWTKTVGNGTTLFDGFGSASNLPGNKAVECLRVFDGQLYAAVGQQESGSGNPVSIWRTGDLTHWTQVGTGTLSSNDTDIFSMETDGTRLFAGTKASSGGANVYMTTNGSAWSWFNAPGNGFYRPGTWWASHLGVLGGNLFAGVLTTNGNQVWKRPADGSANWAKVLDFSTGLGLPGGVPAPGVVATYFYAVSNVLFMPAGNSIYQSTDAAGTNWVPNAGAGAGFGDPNTLNVSSLVECDGYLYAPTHNTNDGGQLWRTPLADALADSAQAWTKVVDRGFGQGAQISELHHICKGLGHLWISTQGPFAQVWRSADGIHWTQSNIDGFATNNPVTSFKPMVETFDGFTVWGGASGTTPSGAQVWQLGPVVPDPALRIQLAGAGSLISWPAGALDFGAEVCSNLLASSWAAATNTVGLSNGQNTVTFGVPAGSAFFRLRQRR